MRSGEAPCFHTNRPQFISSHIDRCEACRLKYARQAEQTTIPYVPTSARRTSGVNQPRSLSRQSVNTGNRPSSSASVGGAAASSMGATTGQNNSNTQRPSSRASVASVASVASAASRLQDAGGRPLRTTTHVRSSSAGAPLLDARANTRRAIARAAEEAMAESGSLPSPPPRGDPIHAAGSSSDTPASPTETVASRSRSRAGRGAKANVRDLMSGAARGRRGSTQSVNSMRRTDSASPTRRIRSNQRPSTAAMPRFDVGNDQPVDMTTAIIGSLVSSARDRDKSAAEKDFEIAQLLKENERLRHMQQQKQAGTATSAESTNIFDPNSADARQKAQERALMHDRVALDKFDEFRRAYEDCEPSLRTNRAQFAGERPLSPPPARPWGSVTPMRTDNGDHDQRLATLAAAEVRRAGEDLMSTPVRRTGRTLRGTSTRRRAVRPLFAGDSELSEDDSDDSDSDEHATLRNCLMSASNFGTFLVQYVTRQCLDHNALSEDYKAKQLRLEELEKRAAQLDKLNRRLEDSRDEHVEQAYEMSQQREQLDEALDTAERTVRRMANENDTLKHDLAQSNERGQTLEDQVSRLNEQLVKARQRCEHDVAAARRVTGAHQQDNVRLSKENEELRGEMKGKLQRAGLKSNVDEYMAGRRKEAASASAVIDAGAQPATETDGAAAESEIKRLQESVQFWRKKTDRVGRKLRSEQAAKKEAHRMLRVQQEETMRYEQLFGPLSDDVGAEPAESLGAYLPSFSGSLENLPEMDGSEAESDVLSNAGSDALIEAVAGESIETGVKTPRMTRMASQSSLSSEGDAPAQAEAEADDQDIRRYEQRMRNRRTATARPMRRRSRPNALAVATGESLGDILGAGSQWGDPTSARSRQGTARGVSSLAAELDAMDFQPSPPLMARSLSNASPVTRPRARSFRGAPPPFGEAPVSAGFGIGFDASVSLAEQFAAAARRPSTTLGRPQTADVGTETVPMSMVVSNVRSVGVDSHLSENAAVAAVSEMRSVEVEPQVSDSMHVNDAGIDAAPGPVLMSVGTATGARPVDRWVEPFDPVARFDRSTDAGVATAARATSHDFESVDAAVGPVCESRDASASSATQSAAAGTTMDIVSADRAACVELELHDQMVQAGESLTMETGTSTAVLTADRVGEPAFVLADHAMSCNVLSCDQLVEAGLEPLQAVGTSTSVEVADVATEQTAASSVNVMVEAAPASNVAVSTADVSVLAADVAVSTVSDTASRSLAVSTMETSTMSTSTMATSTMTASVMATPTMAVATMATSTMAEKASQDTAVSTFTQGSSRSMAVGTDVGAAVSAYTQTEDIPDLHSLPTRLTRAPYGQSPMGSVDSLGSVMGVAPIVGRSLQSVVPRTRPPVPSLAAFAKKQSPRIPLPPLPLQSTSLPGTARFSGARSDLAVNLPRSMSARDVPLARDMPGTPERESDHEDYGYIMVSPRTHVQCVPVPTLSSRTSSLAKPASQDMQLGEANAASLSSRGLGCDDSAADDVSEEVRPARFGTTRAMALQAEDLTPKRSSVSIGVEANMQDQQALTARQPEPLIVQSIARAMVGGHMYKYTPTRFTHNTSRERRHLRYFWIHPYAKLLNWSRQPPSGGVGMARSNRENGGRCVFIRDVRIVDEPHGYADDPNEPSYCIVVSTDHREIKLKATTKSDHDLWFMAMSYLQSRRIITSTTYPAATVAGAASAGYQSDDSAQSRGTSMDSTQRVIMQADRRERHERSRSRNRTAIGSLLGRPPLPPPRPESSSVGSVATTTDSIAPGSVVLPSNASSFEQPPASVHPHRSTLDGTPSRVHSLQSTPRSLRPVSMAMTPGSSDKRLSMGLFRKMGGGGSHTSLFRHGTRTSEDQGDAPSPSIALVMNNATESPSKGSVRKMFSGSFLRALRSRESVVDDDP
ncbi:hypothetical protein GGH98_001895 [Coemansia sp. RSA 454]|nr:hypothetical protein GGH98_001895 [Coemansia sp. RSA 454]